jgi:quercetin dioxygenase-like cupin family protein
MDTAIHQWTGTSGQDTHTAQNEDFTDAMLYAALHLPASLPATDPPASVKSSLLERIHALPPVPVPVPTQQQLRAGKGEFTYQHNDTQGWTAHTHKGIWVKHLAEDKRNHYAVIMMKMEAGSIYPSHDHSGAEQCFVVEGSALVHGHILQAGDFHSSAAGSTHGDIYTATGATLLLVVAREDYKRVYWDIAGSKLKHAARRLLRLPKKLLHKTP